MHNINTRRIKAVNEISTARLCDHGIRAILLDLDNTIVKWGEDTVSEEICEWIQGGRKRGLSFCLVSNSYTHRARRIADDLQIAVVAPAFKPLPFGYIQALRRLDAKTEETLMIGDQFFTDIFGARFLNIRAVWVKPLSDTDFWATRVTRCLERLVLNKGE